MTPDYVLIGHMTADLVHGDRILGGTVSYAARTVSAFGLKVGVLTSADPNDPLLDVLRPYVSDLALVPAASSSTFENIYSAAGRQQYIRAVANRLTPASLPEDWRGAPLVHFAPLTGELDPLDWLNCFPNAQWLLTAQGLLREWDADGRVYFKQWHASRALRAIDWLVLSEEDIAQAPALEAEYARDARHFVLTRAEKGGTHYAAGIPTEYTTPQVEVIQPTGAGDVFAAALLCALHLLGGDVPAALQVAARLGATAVTRQGWEGAPTPAEAQAALEQATQRK
jgi:sugar/nucleoside kinase (ribokinase family)